MEIPLKCVSCSLKISRSLPPSLQSSLFPFPLSLSSPRLSFSPLLSSALPSSPLPSFSLSGITRQGYGEKVCTNHSNQHTSLATRGQSAPADSHMLNNLGREAQASTRPQPQTLDQSDPKLDLLWWTHSIYRAMRRKSSWVFLSVTWRGGFFCCGT